jgi:chemotaxis protein CheC
MIRKIENTPNTATDKNDLGILLELGSIGAGHAATSLSQVLQQQVMIDIPRICTLPLQLLPKFYHRDSTPATAVYMQLLEKLECHIIFMFEMPEAKEITTMMTMRLPPKEREPSMEASAIQELANILIGSFLTAISDFTGVKLVATPPIRIVDSFDSILEKFVTKLASSYDEALILDTCFKREGGYYAPAILMIIPSPELRELLIRKSNQIIGARDENDNISTEKSQEVPE